jgi:pilus assembly protein CpaF
MNLSRLADKKLAVPKMIRQELQKILNDKEISEIIITSFQHIFIESHGKIIESAQIFQTHLELQLFIDEMCSESQIQFHTENPTPSFDWRDFRVQLFFATKGTHDKQLTLRRKQLRFHDMSVLKDLSFFNSKQGELLRYIMDEKKNVCIVGPTGSGKTTLINSLLKLTHSSERIITIEDTREISLPNKCSTALVTRDAPHLQPTARLDFKDLIRLTLRLRPDRIILGEARGDETKDFLLALSTGHKGSLFSIHASCAKEALIRLEMLTLMGAAQWNDQTVRNLIRFGIDFLVVLGNNKEQRQIVEIVEIAGLEPSGFLLRTVG